jgi:signal transduction histidine kinase
MKFLDVNYFNIGPRLMLIFAILIALILGGNGLLLWQFHTARLQTDRLTGVSQQLIEVLRLQESLLLFHQQLDGLAKSKDAHLLISEAEPLCRNLLEQTQRTRTSLTHLPSAAPVDPAILPTLEAIEIILPSQIKVITALAASADWEAVHLRLANELEPLETQTSSLVRSIDQQVSGELSRAVENMRTVQRRILLLLPITAMSTFFIAAAFAWAIARRILELRFDERLAERTRLARELHDTFLQTIQGSKLVADGALEESSDPARMRRAMEQLSDWLEQASQEGRAALNSLRTSTAQGNDLAEAFERAIAECRTRSPIEASFSLVGDNQDIHSVVRDEVFHIGSEAIRNACAHSRGSQLKVELKYAHDLALRVRDNGVGFDLAMADKGKAGHFGLRGMRERAARIGGKFTIVSSANFGTEVTVVVPGRIVFQRPSESETTSESVKAIFYRRPAPVENSRENSVDDVFRKLCSAKTV